MPAGLANCRMAEKLRLDLGVSLRAGRQVFNLIQRHNSSIFQTLYKIVAGLEIGRPMFTGSKIRDQGSTLYKMLILSRVSILDLRDYSPQGFALPAKWIIEV